MAFDTAVGGTPLLKAYVGTSPTARIYVGDKHVWPPISGKVTWIGSTVATGTANTFPAHVANDLLVAVLYGTDVAPNGYTLAAKQTSPMKVALVYKWATAPNTAVGTLTGATFNSVYVFRNANPNAPFGATGTASNTGLTATAPALTLTDPSGDSAVCHAFIQTGASGAWVNKVQANFISKNLNARLANTQMIDTKTATAAASTLTHSVSASWTGLSFEVVAVPSTPVEEPLWLYDVAQTNKGGGVVDFALKKGLGPYDPLDEGFMFRCVQFPTLNGYVPRNFTKNFPPNGYSGLDCTVEDLYGDGTANPEYLHKTISFKVYL
jgi:hypothetical protein